MGITYPFNYEEIDKNLTTTTTKRGDCLKVEKAIKNYLTDFIKYMKQIENLSNNETIRGALNIENIKTDGPDFNNTRQVLSKSKTSIETVTNDFSNYLTEEAAMSYIKDLNLDEHYSDIYKNYVLGKSLAEMESARNEMMTSLNILKSLVENEQEAIDFLVNNKESWEVDNDQLIFDSDSLVEQYNNIVKKIQELG